MSITVPVRTFDRDQKALEAMVAELRMQARNATIVADVLEGRSRKAVAAEHGISLSRVHELMVAAGFKNANPKNLDRDISILADLDGGRSVKEVAEAAGLSVSRVELIAMGRNCRPLPNKRADR